MVHVSERRGRTRLQQDWKEVMRAKIGNEFDTMSGLLGTAIREGLREADVQTVRDRIVSEVQARLDASSTGSNVRGELLRAEAARIQDPQTRAVVQAAGAFMIKLQRETGIPQQIGRSWIDSEANKIVARVRVEEAQGHN